MFLIGAGTLDVSLLSEGSLELGLSLIQDDGAHYPALDLGGEEPDLLSVRCNVFRQDLCLSV